MNKLYFLRGFGTGVIFCVFVMGIACAYRTSEGQIIKEARKLGMRFEEEQDEPLFAATSSAVKEGEGKKTKKNNKDENGQEDTTSDNEQTIKENDASSESESPKEDVKPEQSEKPQSDTRPKQSEKLRKSAKPKESAAPVNPAGEKGEKVSFTIRRGMWSDSVAAALEKEGLIDNAKAFDKYLGNNGYASYIRTGTYLIPRGASYKEIAELIAGKDA